MQEILAKREALQRMEDANESGYEEEGEQEMEEMEEYGEEELSEDDEDIPQVVPIGDTGIDHTAKAETSSISDIDVDDYGRSSDAYDSDELDLDTTANPHGFVYSNMLETFQKSRKERIE